MTSHLYSFLWGYHRDPWWGSQRTLVKKCCPALHHVSSHSLQGLCSLRELVSLHIAWALVGLENKCTRFCAYLAFGRPGFSLSIIGSLSIIAGSVFTWASPVTAQKPNSNTNSRLGEAQNYLNAIRKEKKFQLNRWFWGQIVGGDEGGVGWFFLNSIFSAYYIFDIILVLAIVHIVNFRYSSLWFNVWPGDKC